jgi:hypothetical protein
MIDARKTAYPSICPIFARKFQTTESATIQQRQIGNDRSALLFNQPMGTQEDFSDLYTSLAISHAQEFPDVPQPDATLTPHLLAARWQSHDLYGEDMPRLAADMLEAGYDTPSLIRLAGEINIKSSADVEPLVGRMFQELGIKYPIKEKEAKLIVSRQTAREVIAGQRNAWAAANHLEIGIWGWEGTAIPQLDEIYMINDEIDWEPKYRRPVEDLKTSLLNCFASLARLTDSDIFQ